MDVHAGIKKARVTVVIVVEEERVATTNNKIKKKEIIIIKIINDNKKGRNTIDNTRATAILQYNCLQSSVAAVNHYFHCGYSLSVVYITLIRHSIRC